MYSLFKDRFPSWLPGTVVKETLQKHPLHISLQGACQLNCLDLSEEIIKELLINGDVNFSESQVHDAKCPVYAIDGSDYPGGKLRVFFEQCDSITVLASALYLNNPHNCGCD